MIECHFFGKGVRFHHVGLGVRSIAEVHPDAEQTVDEIQRSAVAFVALDGVVVELVEPTGDDSPVAASVRKGAKLLHLCYEVPDLEAALKSGRAFGFHRIGRVAPARAFGGRRIVWVFSKVYGLVELLERRREDAS